MNEKPKPLAAPASPAARLLVVSREPAALGTLWTVGQANGWEINITGSGCEALERVQSGSGPDLVLLDVARGDADGLYTLRWLRRVRPEVSVVLLAHADDPQQRVEAMRLGAHDYLLWPVSEPALEMAIRGNLNSSGDGPDPEIVSEKIEAIGEDTFFVASTPIMRKLRAQAELLAQVDLPVLIVGESGSGKEATARLIHKLSVRSGFHFRKVNCAALTGDLLERELLGYELSALAGTTYRREGKFELAEKGTVLLDDIAEIPASLQVKLLQVLDDKQFVRGGHARVEVDVRIIASTNGKIERALVEKKLREDLYYRLSAFTIHVPPLRQRREEIPLLLGYCMNQMARRYALPAREFSPAVVEACRVHHWPGNLRELENFVKRCLVMGGDEELILSELRQGWHRLDQGPQRPAGEIAAGLSAEAVESGEDTSGLRSLVDSVKGEAERNAIAAALEQTHWNRKAAARLLKVSYRTLLYKIQHYHMNPPPSYLDSSLLAQGIKRNDEGR
jgi:two-component system, NtrC family, response regulator AtoC